MKRFISPAAMLSGICFGLFLTAFAQDVSTEAQNSDRDRGRDRDDKVVGAVYVASNSIYGK